MLLFHTVTSFCYFNHRNKDFDGGIMGEAYIPIIPNTTAHMHNAIV